MAYKEPLLTIITASFNSEKTIAKTIESILKQTINCFEYIIIDGGSKDNTVSIIKSYEKKFINKQIPFKWISEKDSGIYNALNKGIKLSKGKWISFLGSDDIYLNNALELYEKHLLNISKKIDFIHSNVEVENGKQFAKNWSWKSFKRKMTIAHVGGFHNVKYFNENGLFNEKYKIAGDYELLLRAKENLKVSWLNNTTVIMGDNGISNNQIKKVYLETTKAKIETAKISQVIAKVDYLVWMFKYELKKVFHAIVR